MTVVDAEQSVAVDDEQNAVVVEQNAVVAEQTVVVAEQTVVAVDAEQTVVDAEQSVCWCWTVCCWCWTKCCCCCSDFFGKSLTDFCSRGSFGWKCHRIGSVLNNNGKEWGCKIVLIKLIAFFYLCVEFPRFSFFEDVAQPGRQHVDGSRQVLSTEFHSSLRKKIVFYYHNHHCCVTLTVIHSHLHSYCVCFVTCCLKQYCVKTFKSFYPFLGGWKCCIIVVFKIKLF